MTVVGVHSRIAAQAAIKLKEIYGNSLVAVVPRPKIEDGEQLLLLIAQVRMPSREALQLRDKLLEEWWDGLDDPLKNNVIIGIEHVR